MKIPLEKVVKGQMQQQEKSINSLQTKEHYKKTLLTNIPGEEFSTPMAHSKCNN